MTSTLLALMLAALAPAILAAPKTKLTLSGFNGNFGNVQLADFDQGYITSASGITYTVSQVGTNTTARTTSIYIRANAATMSGGKSTSNCSWRRDDLATWTPLTTTDAFVEAQPIQTSGQSWSNTLWVRCTLDWASDPPAANSVAFTISLQVTP
ncbi:MAG TPA: hypothetical protein VFK16_08480 [Gemmatimonadaceae bacterium]|nr:hypothetical protein [Gemmatimonadaceae bacterium]